MARLDRTVRLEAIKRALASSRHGVALRTLAERGGWSLRSVYRDVEALELAGYPVVRDQGRVRLDASAAEPMGAPDADERLALFLARDAARAWKHTSLGQALERLWNRVSAAGSKQGALLPMEATPWITTREWSGIDYGRHRQHVSALERAVRERLAVQARYRAQSTGKVTARVIEPGQLHVDPVLESLYLIAWCRLRNDVRVFAVHRFLAITLLDERCSPRSETRSQAALRTAFRVWRGGHVEKVQIWFAPEVAGEIRERRWLPNQRLEEEPGGALVLNGEVAGLAEVQRWVLGYGAAARVLGPPAFRRSIEKALRRTSNMYANPLPAANTAARKVEA